MRLPVISIAIAVEIMDLPGRPSNSIRADLGTVGWKCLPALVEQHDDRNNDHDANREARSLGIENGVHSVVHRVCDRAGECVALPVPVLSERWWCLSRTLPADASAVWHTAVLSGNVPGSV